MNTRGPYRLTGGAGTGKTVVLVHRAVRLPARPRRARFGGTDRVDHLHPQPRRLPRGPGPQPRRRASPRPDALGNPGIHVTGVDRIAHDIVNSARGPRHHDGRRARLGSTRRAKYSPPPDDWHDSRRQLRPRPARSETSTSRTSSPSSSTTSTARSSSPPASPTKPSTCASPAAGAEPGWAATSAARSGPSIAAYREAGSRISTLDWDETTAVAAAVLDRQAACDGQNGSPTTSSSTRDRTCAPPSGSCSGRSSPRARTTCSSPRTPTSASIPIR